MAAGKVSADAAVTKSQERIYSAQQLVQALKSGAAAIKEQLQVLCILDGTASSWPGVNQAVDDMEFIIDMVSQTTQRLEKNVKTSDTKAEDCSAQVATLKDTLATANQRCEELQRECTQSAKDVRQLNSKLDASTKEAAQLRQDVWSLEKQRADLASELEKYKQDNSFMEVEVSNLRTTVNDQLQQITSLKEDLAARNSDVQHYSHSVAEYKAQVSELRKQLESTSGNLRALQNQLEHLRSEKQHFERESDRQADEAARLTAELNKVTTEAQRQREWAVVVKKVEADKLREEQQAHHKSRIEFEQAKGELEKTIARLSAELSGRDQGLAAKTAEAASLSKQNGLFNIQVRDLQKQLAVMQADKASMLRQQEVTRAEVAKLQSRIQAGATQAAQVDKERMMAEGKAKELAAADRAKLEAAYKEAAKEAAVQRALAEGWSRDIKEVQARLAAEQSRSQAMKDQIDTVMRSKEGESHQKHMEMVKQVATMEQVIRDMRAQLSGKEAELRRVKAEASSAHKMLEKQIERLQRECDESANEVARLRNSDAFRLPALARPQPQTLQEELDQLKRFVSDRSVVVVPSSAPGRQGPVSLPPTRPATNAAPPQPPKQVTVLRHPTR